MNFDASLALRADGLLGSFNQAGILSAADVHVARRLGAISGETSDPVLLAIALVVRSTRHGSVVLDLDTAEATTSPDVDEEELDGPVVEVALDWPTVPHFGTWLRRTGFLSSTSSCRSPAVTNLPLRGCC